MKRIGRRTYLTLVAGGTLAVSGCGGEEDPDAAESPDETERDASATDDESEAAANDEAADAEDDESDAENVDDDSDDENANGDPEFEVGSLLELDDLALVVSGVDREDERVDSEDEVIEAAEGSTFAIVDLAVQYAGDESVGHVDELVSFELSADVDGETEDAAALEDEADIATSRLAPGEVVRGDLAYEIDDDATALSLDVESLVDGTDYAVDLESETEPPDALEQEPDGEVLAFGEGVERDGIEVTMTTLEQGNNLGGFMQSDEGYEIVAAGLIVDNESGRERTLSADQVRLTDEFGRSYEDAPRAVRALEGVDGTALDDGEEFEGKVAYQVEDDVSELYLVFDFEEWGDDERVFWQVR